MQYDEEVESSLIGRQGGGSLNSKFTSRAPPFGHLATWTGIWHLGLAEGEVTRLPESGIGSRQKDLHLKRTRERHDQRRTSLTQLQRKQRAQSVRLTRREATVSPRRIIILLLVPNYLGRACHRSSCRSATVTLPACNDCTSDAIYSPLHLLMPLLSTWLGCDGPRI